MRIGVVGEELESCVTVDALRQASAPQRCLKVFVVIWHGFGLQNGLLIFTGFATEARCDCRLSRVSRDARHACPHSRLPEPTGGRANAVWLGSMLGTWHDKVPWHLESKNVSREKRSGAGAPGGTSVDWGLCCVICRNRRIAPVDYKSLEHCQAGDKRRIECARIGPAHLDLDWGNPPEAFENSCCP